ncbi:S8 family serine peptidase [Chryseobacterium chendengshani]|uniref:S8 family serine peptidase n=1 Tax=Chryseobacterium sp. LJ756 TaxID=2864113 RepID=UPI001C641029|nr:S8 family serine peptidase [Chryseobacterium sp. LJ756]MBW7675633.1 S8 family serine peptidase [Chryseobacterium sp. LJ756]
MKNKYYLIVSLILPLSIAAQSAQERTKIASFSNKIGNQILKEELMRESNNATIRVTNYLKNNPAVKKRIFFGEDNWGIREIMDIAPNGEIIYAETYNDGASKTARANRLYTGGSLGINIQGQNMIAGVWDGGNAQSTHQEFMVNGVTKINLLDGADYQSHPTHVSGTIAAQGIVSNARGIAFNSSINSYNWDSDLSEMLSQASTGLLTSNHSYGIGQLGSIWFFGAYDSRARQFDNICYNNPYYLPVVSAGNSRNETTAPGSTQLTNKFGWDMIFGHANAKNIITVAAVQNVSNYVDPSSVIMSTFSSYGPSDDGRIKPDISMKGVAVYSTNSSSTNNTSYASMQGTSMASPGVTGVVLLLQQYHNQLYANYLKAATVKGLILHTADEAGSYIGPDYEFGWGLINAEKSAITIRDKNSLTSSKSVVEELTLNNGTTFTKTITANGTSPLKVSISWTDPAASTTDVNSGTIDPSTKYLVNDLDVKVTKAETTYYPWKLQGMADFAGAPTNISTNNVDNFERVDINNPSGTYTITVTHKGTLTGGLQNFSLIATSDSMSTLSMNEAIAANDTKVDFYPNPAKNYIQINEKDKDLLINIYDVSGKLVLTSKLADNKIDISQLVKGNYLANFINKKGVIKNFKFIKE